MPPRPRARRRTSASPDPGRRTPSTVIAGRALVRGRIQPVEVGIDEEGWILRVAKSISGGRRHDEGDRILVPSGTDLHVHLREPDGPHPAETFRTGTEAAAFGGFGTVADMPNSVPPSSSPDRMEAKAARARGEAAVDLVLYAALLPDSSPQRLAAASGAFKLFMSPTTGIESPPDGLTRQRLLAQAAMTGLAVTVHAEEPDKFQPRLFLRSPLDWDAARPLQSELAAVEELLPAPDDLRLHVAHVTAAAVADRLRDAGQSFEVTAHHLLLAAGGELSARTKVNPPLRSEVERAGLWEAFRAGRVPCLASDHAPHAIAEKERPFAEAPSGMPGVETTLPLLLEKVRAGELDLGVLQAAVADRPARWLGLPQGRLAPGHRANLLVVDFRHRSEVRSEKLRSLCGWTAFEGWPAIFPERHFHGGDVIVDDGTYVGRRDGKVLRPEYAPGAAAFGRGE